VGEGRSLDAEILSATRKPPAKTLNPLKVPFGTAKFSRGLMKGIARHRKSSLPALLGSNGLPVMEKMESFHE